MSLVTYTGLKEGMLRWMQRPDDTLLEDAFDDFLLNAERRMYYGHATEDIGNPLRSDPLRVPEMQTVNAAFAMTSGTVAQPTGFLELISVYNNSNSSPMEIVAERTIDGYGSQTLGGTYKIAISGTNFRLKDAPTSITATLRYYVKLTTPASPSTVNAILTTYPDVYLNACLYEANTFCKRHAEALTYLALYNASVAGLNARTQRITASTAPKIRVRAGLTP